MEINAHWIVDNSGKRENSSKRILQEDRTVRERRRLADKSKSM